MSSRLGKGAIARFWWFVYTSYNDARHLQFATKQSKRLHLKIEENQTSEIRLLSYPMFVLGLSGLPPQQAAGQGKS